jgi:hypothetical protein
MESGARDTPSGVIQAVSHKLTFMPKAGVSMSSAPLHDDQKMVAHVAQ